MSRTRLSAIVLSVLALITTTVSQSSNVTQCSPDYQWSLNSLGQTPCLVAAYLEQVCTTQPLQVNEIPPGNHYLGPSFAQADACKCSTVTYSLISACGGCQNRPFTTWINWTLNCPAIYVSLYPKTIPTGTDVPLWAYINVTQTNNTFDLAAARDNATQTPSPASSPSSPSGTADTPPSISSSSTAPSTKSNNAGAIAGGVVGGIVGLVAVALVLFWFFLRRGSGWGRRARAQDRVDLDEDDIPAMSPPPMTSYEGHTGTPISSPMSPYNHSRDPSDLGSLGSPVTSTGIYTTFGGRGSMESVPYNPSQATRGYTGAAEI